jgi:hypothetical protein
MLSKIRKRYQDGALWQVVARRLKAPLQTKPINATSPGCSYVESHLHKGEDYHEKFSNLPARRLMWKMEQEILDSFSHEQGPFAKHLDFAGGTGRIATVLEKHCDTQYILDVSDNMLAVAAQNLRKAIILNRDFNKGVPELEDGGIDLATAFRFFPNAEPELREKTMHFLAQKVRQGGWLVCNNHRNFWSAPYIFQRLTFQGGEFGMTNSEMMALAQKCGFSLFRSYSIGVLPQTEDRRAILPRKLAGFIENALLQRVGEIHRLGFNVIFIFRRA